MEEIELVPLRTASQSPSNASTNETIHDLTPTGSVIPALCTPAPSNTPVAHPENNVHLPAVAPPVQAPAALAPPTSVPRPPAATQVPILLQTLASGLGIHVLPLTPIAPVVTAAQIVPPPAVVAARYPGRMFNVSRFWPLDEAILVVRDPQVGGPPYVLPVFDPTSQARAEYAQYRLNSSSPFRRWLHRHSYTLACIVPAIIVMVMVVLIVVSLSLSEMDSKARKLVGGSAGGAVAEE